MRNSTGNLVVLVGLLVFAIGVVVGQQTHRSKFDKYLQTGSVTSMQLAMLYTNVEMIRDQLPIGGEVGVGTPEIYYNERAGSFTAFVNVTDQLTNKPVTQVRGMLLGLADIWLKDLQRSIPEASKENFKITFHDFTIDAIKQRKDRNFAEYRNGELFFK